MKLRVVELLLVSTLPAMVLAEGGLPSLSLTVATLIGGTLAAGSANAFNMVIESESDKLMKRTAKRPLATGLLTKSQAIVFATVIGVISLIVFQIYLSYNLVIRGNHPREVIREEGSLIDLFCFSLIVIFIFE
jgi:protoheme IX farnesyltransferase